MLNKRAEEGFVSIAGCSFLVSLFKLGVQFCVNVGLCACVCFVCVHLHKKNDSEDNHCVCRCVLGCAGDCNRL